MKFLIFGLVAILFSAPITGMVPNVDAISTFNINMSCVGETLTVVISDENGDPVIEETLSPRIRVPLDATFCSHLGAKFRRD